MKNTVERAWPVLVWIGIWQALSVRLGSGILLASPLRVAARLLEMVASPGTWRILLNSTVFVLSGFLLSLLLAIPCAVLARRYTAFRRLMIPPVKVMRSVPVASFIILALVFVSSRHLSVLIAFTVSFPLFFTELISALDERDRQLEEFSRVFRLPLGERVWRIDFPQVLPKLATTCRTATGVCWKAGVAAEIIGIPKVSIGEQMHMAKLYLDTADLFAWTILILILSALFEAAVQAGLRRLTSCAKAL